MNKIELHESILNNSQMTFARSGGNGGQNVNKVNTKVHLVMPVTAIGGITEEERNHLKVKLSSILNKDDCLFLDSLCFLHNSQSFLQNKQNRFSLLFQNTCRLLF